MDNILERLGRYEVELVRFVSEHQLPTQWFEVPDHIAVKGADGADFEHLVEQFRPLADQISCLKMDRRRLATAQLTESLNVGRFGYVQWVEIMEPRPEKVGKDVVGLEHMEFYYPDFVEIRRILNDFNVTYEIQENPGHQWVNVVINSSGQELKLNNKLLADIVVREIKTGQAYMI